MNIDTDKTTLKDYMLSLGLDTMSGDSFLRFSQQCNNDLILTIQNLIDESKSEIKQLRAQHQRDIDSAYSKGFDKGYKHGIGA
jgi:hypothetical protein